MASQALAAPMPRSVDRSGAQVPSVLVLDSDDGAVSHCTAMLGELGYPHHGASSPREALDMVLNIPDIQILLTNVDLPAPGGFDLIEEARLRAGESRPIAAILVAERATIDIAVRGLHFEAVDLLEKPLALESYSTALRRAMRFLAARRPAATTNLSGFGDQLARLVVALESKGGEGQADAPATDKDIAATLRHMISSRALRARYFPGELFADPAWDILLDLTRAGLERQQVSVSSVCIAASVPMSTALRWVRQMTDANLLRRWTDPKDRRRDLIALTEQTAGHMRDYLTTIHGQLRKLTA